MVKRRREDLPPVAKCYVRNWNEEVHSELDLELWTVCLKA
jgi:hypothetical protein